MASATPGGVAPILWTSLTLILFIDSSCFSKCAAASLKNQLEEFAYGSVPWSGVNPEVCDLI
jgi:hypothetical protein